MNRKDTEANFAIANTLSAGMWSALDDAAKGVEVKSKITRKALEKRRVLDRRGGITQRGRDVLRWRKARHAVIDGDLQELVRPLLAAAAELLEADPPAALELVAMAGAKISARIESGPE